MPSRRNPSIDAAGHPPPVRYEVDQDVAVIALENPPVNALTPEVLAALARLLDQATGEAQVKAMVLIGSGRMFSAGADIRRLEQLAKGKLAPNHQLRRLIDCIEAASKPVVAAIHGMALGGGLEVALGCHFRIATPSAEIALPEVKLGLIPGAGGTQRLPRLCGVSLAARLCATGETMTASDALEAGIIDHLADSDAELRSQAVRWAREAAAGARRTRAGEFAPRFVGPEADNELATLAATLSPKMRGQIAPAKAIDAVRVAGTVPFEEGLDRESELFLQCARSDQADALIHLFLAERSVAGRHRNVSSATIRQASIVGAGAMGRGIAIVYLDAGIPVHLIDVSPDPIEVSFAAIQEHYQRQIDRGKLSQQQVAERVSRLTRTTQLASVRRADIIVEAIPESLEMKRKLFSALDALAKPSAILASNTSSLDLDKLAAATRLPARVIGHHFFNPAPAMRLLEIVRGQATCDEVIATSMKLARQLGKIAVLVGNGFGFVGNRMFGPYQREAQFLVEEGATVAQVDQALRGFGMAMGPLEVSDLAGIDVGWRIRQQRTTTKLGTRKPLVADELYERGRYGRKTGAGWYRYEGRNIIPDPAVETLVQQTAEAAGIRRRKISDEEIVGRTMAALINEGAHLLSEQIARRAADIDLVYVHGFGFPRWRGGPMKYADRLGLKTIYDEICRFETTHGDCWQPAPLLKTLADHGDAFSELNGSTGAI